MNVFGAYCSISEEPLPDVAYIWHADGTEYPPFEPPEDYWDNLLLVSPATYEAWNRHREIFDSFELFLPHKETTFSLEDSPFVYSAEEVDVFYLDDGGAELTSEAQEIVIVRGNNDKARATIEAFELNTRYFNDDEKQMRIPYQEYLSRQDPRVLSRTQAWRWATEAARQLSLVPRIERGPMLSQLRISAASSGFWSVWATVLWNQFHDVDLLAVILGARSDLQTDPDLVGPGPHNEFPGTAPEWLELQEMRVA